MRMPWPFRNMGLKVLSVAFAVMLWFGVSGDELASWTWGVASGREVRKPEPMFPRLEVAAG